MTAPNAPLYLIVTPAPPDEGAEAVVRLSQASEVFDWRVEGSIEPLRQAVEEIVRTAIQTLGDINIRTDALVAVLEAALFDAGYAISMAEEKTVEITAEFDIRTGRILSQGELTDNEVARDLHRAITLALRADGEALNADCIRAMGLGPVYEAARPQTPSGAPVSRADIEKALDAFARHVSGETRLTFWRAGKKQGDDHIWCDQPEQNGQTLLHTYLRGRFGGDISIFQEVGSGAGRIDILLQVTGDLKAVIELKLCGYNYTSHYAASGSDQLDHYMKSSGIYLGYLVVFDARLNDNGKTLDVIAPAQGTIKTWMIDVTPRVSKRPPKAKP